MVKMSRNRLKLRSGEIRKFGSKRKRDNFEKMAKATRHGFKPTKRKKGY